MRGGTNDLLQDATLSQPFTVFDQLLLGLDRKASEVVKDLRPEKNDFRPSRRVPDGSSKVWYDKSSARTVIELGLPVNGIDDPWRDVCAKRVKAIAGPGGLWLPDSEAWEITARIFFFPLLGPHIVSDNVNLANYKAFSDSIVVALIFLVESVDGAKPWKFSRQCFWDNKTGQVSFREHKY